MCLEVVPHVAVVFGLDQRMHALHATWRGCASHGACRTVHVARCMSHGALACWAWDICRPFGRRAEGPRLSYAPLEEHLCLRPAPAGSSLRARTVVS